MNRSKKYKVSCRSCGAESLKAACDIRKWSGLCRPCADEKKIGRKASETTRRNMSLAGGGDGTIDPKCVDCGEDVSSKLHKRCWSCLKKNPDRLAMLRTMRVGLKNPHLEKLNKSRIGGKCPWTGKFNKSRAGRKEPDALRIKMSLRQGGDGDLKRVRRARGSAEHKAWIQAVFKRDNYTCQACGARNEVAGRLNADHILPWSEFKELRFDLSNGRTMCELCHEKTPTYGHRQAKRIRILAQAKANPNTFNIFYDI